MRWCKRLKNKSCKSNLEWAALSQGWRTHRVNLSKYCILHKYMQLQNICICERQFRKKRSLLKPFSPLHECFTERWAESDSEWNTSRAFPCYFVLSKHQSHKDLCTQIHFTCTHFWFLEFSLDSKCQNLWQQLLLASYAKHHMFQNKQGVVCQTRQHYRKWMLWPPLEMGRHSPLSLLSSNPLHHNGFLMG